MKDFILAVLPLVACGITIAIVVTASTKKKKSLAIQKNIENKELDKKEKNTEDDNMTMGMCLGMSLGLAFSSKFGGYAVTYGISFGMLLGAIIGMNTKKK